MYRFYMGPMAEVMTGVDRRDEAWTSHNRPRTTMHTSCDIIIVICMHVTKLLMQEYEKGIIMHG